MRGFWGVPSCDSPADIPKELSRISWCGEDRVSYTLKGDEGEEEKIVATTLKGIARQSLPNNVFEEFFEEVISAEKEIYSWPVRGPRIFQQLTNMQQGGNRIVPDIIALSEYDCHTVNADYRQLGKSETFADAMAATGYDGIFFKDPLLGREPPSGLGLFWNKDVFSTVSGLGGIKDIECNKNAFRGDASNRDLNEKWHPIKKLKDDDSNYSQPKLMKASDRRNAGLVRLLHKPTGRTLAVCTTHLMTTSRDNSKTNKYPGEVRAGELVEICQIISEKAGANDGIILMGDFNTDARLCKKIFGGKIPKIVQSDDGGPGILEFDTGFDTETNSFSLGNSRQLVDSFSEIHQWGDGVGEGKHCTSRNAERIEW
eukprot:CAMPEP_0194217500 /NCGR_PEP_ID=MMETSP0156-20130528/21414_1 /TAXON_ID=33649 /ORGANISM="Thalassionema nitzschioides, Strain L26-B" /LENGTH=370 /DNA_ID=CAMNT_0038946563 /DNA_START=275 /DNA_END=1384 /DNA_ORIENTATION=+